MPVDRKGDHDILDKSSATKETYSKKEKNQQLGEALSTSRKRDWYH